MLQMPKKFFVTSGKAVSKVSDLNAFDEALLNASIGEQNLVYVSSILPVGVKQTRRTELPMGAITHCVLARQGGGEGETISAGIADALREVLEWKMAEMAKLRGVKFKSLDYKIEDLSIPMDHYGVCLAALVFLF